MSRVRRDPLARIALRPDPAQWGDDEPMTLAEAAALFFPQGPLTLCSLRTAVGAGKLEIARVAGKDLTTPRAIRKLVKPTCRAARQNLPASGSETTPPAGSSSIASGRSAQAAAAMTLKAQRKRSKRISQNATSPRPAALTLVSSR